LKANLSLNIHVGAKFWKGQKRVRAVTLADYKKYSKERQAKISSRRVTVISDSDDDFESPPKLLQTSDINTASPSPSYSPIQSSSKSKCTCTMLCTICLV